VGKFIERGWGGASAELARDFYTKAGPKGLEGLARLDEADRSKAELQRLTEAAEGGDADSRLQLGKVLEYGWMGATVDLDRAESLYRQAADAGNAAAQYTLGLFLIKTRARDYIQLAVNQGHWDAPTYLNRISYNF
jgi:TPR repeat protein